MTLSYYAQNQLTLTDHEGNKRPLKPAELEFIKMVEQACQLGCGLKQFRQHDKVRWILDNPEGKQNIMQKIVPIHNKVAVRPDPPEETVAGYAVPDSAKQAPRRGTVIAVGPGKHADETGVQIPMQVEIGDVVYYSKFAGTEITVNEESLLLLREEEILMILKQ